MTTRIRKLNGDQLTRWSLALLSSISVVTTLGVVAVLAGETFEFFKQVSVFDFLTGTRWEPLLEPKSFGVLPLVAGTLLITLGAALFAVPIGLMTAVFLSEYASPKTRSWLKSILEILAGIPTVVYGYFALSFVTPVLRVIFPQTQVFNAASGAIVVGIMILPMISSLADDAIRELPANLRESGYSLGGTSFEVIWEVLIPAAFPRIIAAVVLAISRAVGETMAVTLAAGATPQMTLNPLESIQTMTAYIVQVSMGDTPAGGIEYLSSYAVGTLLFVFTLAMNLVAFQFARKRRKLR